MAAISRTTGKITLHIEWFARKPRLFLLLLFVIFNFNVQILSTDSEPMILIHAKLRYE